MSRQLESWLGGQHHFSSILCALKLLVLITAGHSLDYPLQYLQKHLSNLLGKVKLQQAGGQKAREATPVSSPSSEQFNIVARAIYEIVRPEQVVPVGCTCSVTISA